jgi:hypothetical protein
MGHGEAPIITDDANDSSDSAEEIRDVPEDAHSSASAIFNLESILRPVSSIKKSLFVTLDVQNVGYRNCPQYDVDPYRNFSI